MEPRDSGMKTGKMEVTLMADKTTLRKLKLQVQISVDGYIAGPNGELDGGALFDSWLIKAGLIDEFHLFVNPAAIGNGMAIFKDVN
jgi:RibD C-terminal domain